MIPTIKDFDNKWDFLVILDACRYDSFEQVYKEFFKNNNHKLMKGHTIGSCTADFMIKTFDGKYDDIIYISGNPNMNSKCAVSGLDQLGQEYYYKGSEHFNKIVDVWDFGWDEKLGTVPPLQINKAFHREYMRNPDKKFVLHYLQPHLPYITLGGNPDPKAKPYQLKKRTDIRQKVKKKIKNKIPEMVKWNIKKFINMPVGNNVELFWRIGGRELIEEIYKDEIRFALSHVKMLMDHITGDWIITSDHGERICQLLKYTHGGKLDKDLREIPILTISNKL